jgi:uncharacterized protein (UPF0264 family)
LVGPFIYLSQEGVLTEEFHSFHAQVRVAVGGDQKISHVVGSCHFAPLPCFDDTYSMAALGAAVNFSNYTS